MWKNLIEQNVPNSEKERIQYFHEVQRVASLLKQTYSDDYERLIKNMLDLNIKEV